MLYPIWTDKASKRMNIRLLISDWHQTSTREPSLLCLVEMARTLTPGLPRRRRSTSDQLVGTDYPERTDELKPNGFGQHHPNLSTY